MRNRLLTIILLSAAAGLCPAMMNAAALTWDTSSTDSGAITGGAGTWDTTTANWTPDNGATDSAWVSGSDAIFGGTGGSVQLSAVLVAGNVSIGSGYTLQVNNQLTATSVVLGTGAKVFFAGNNAVSKIIGNIDLEGGVLVANSGNNGTLNGLFTGSGALLMNDGASYGNGFTQSAASLTNTYAGNTTIVNNVVTYTGYNATNFSVFGTGTTLTLTGQTGSYGPSAGIIFNPSATGNTYTITQNLVLSSTTGNVAYIQQNDGITRFTGTASITTDSNTASAVQFFTQYNGKDIYLDGVVSGSGNITVSDISGNYGSGSLHLTNAGNTYSGTITATDSKGAFGILSIDNATAAQYATVNLAGTTNGGRLRLNGTNVTIAGLNGTVANAAVFNTDTTLRTLTINGAANSSFAGAIGVAGTYSYDGANTTTNGANIALVKSGAGTLTLSGNNAYTGGTTVSVGSLIVANGGKILNTSATGVTIASGASLTVNGTLQLAAVSAKIINAGTFVAGGTLDLGGYFDTYVNGTYQLITGAGSNSGTFSVTGYNTGTFSNVAYNGVTGLLTFTAVPEPSTYGLLGAGALAGIALIRRRKRA